MRASLILCLPAASLCLWTLGALAEPADATASPPSRASYQVDGVHSSVLFKVRHMSVSDFYGCFERVEGTIVEDSEEPENSSVSITIQADSVDSRSENRDQHLTSPDFFSAIEFPEISFESSEVARGEEEGSYRVTGTLTARGVGKQMTIDVHKIGERETRRGVKAGFATTFTIDMRDYKMPAMQQMDPSMLSPEVELIVSLEVAKS